jgi:hypothetical protein
MIAKLIASLATAGAALAAAIALAPMAAASSDIDCQGNGLTAICQRSGPSALVPRPGGLDSPIGNPAYWPSSAGPIPQVWAFN